MGEKEQLLEIAKPILFNTEMVRAILENRKIVTRRICKALGNYDFKWGLDEEPYIGDYRVFKKIGFREWGWVTLENQWLFNLQTAIDDCRTGLLKPPYQVGDIIYVRETWCRVGEDVDSIFFEDSGEMYNGQVLYRADGIDLTGIGRWRPSIHMPKKLARIFLRVTDVRLERLQDILNADIGEELTKEGIICDDGGIKQFAHLWDSTLKNKNSKEYKWENDPWVWVISFEKCLVE